MKILYYEPLPTLGRARRAGKLCRALQHLGHEVHCFAHRHAVDPNSERIVDCINPLAGFLYLPLAERLHLVSEPATSDAAATMLERYIAKHAFDRILLWNGLDEVFQAGLAAFNVRDLPVLYGELSWFDQQLGFYIDPQGVNGASSLLRAELPRLTTSQAAALGDFRLTYAGARQRLRQPASRRRALVVLQCENDSNIRLFSPFQQMRDFIHFLASWIPGEGWDTKIRRHPLQADFRYEFERGDFSFSDARTAITQEILDADLVIGINSTALLEALLLARPVCQFGTGIGSRVLPRVSLQDSFDTALARHISLADVDSLLFTLALTKQIPWGNPGPRLTEIFGVVENKSKQAGVPAPIHANKLLMLRGRLFTRYQHWLAVRETSAWI